MVSIRTAEQDTVGIIARHAISTPAQRPAVSQCSVHWKCGGGFCSVEPGWALEEILAKIAHKSHGTFKNAVIHYSSLSNSDL